MTSNSLIPNLMDLQLNVEYLITINVQKESKLKYHLIKVSDELYWVTKVSVSSVGIYGTGGTYIKYSHIIPCLTRGRDIIDFKIDNLSG